MVRPFQQVQLAWDNDKTSNSVPTIVTFPDLTIQNCVDFIVHAVESMINTPGQHTLGIGDSGVCSIAFGALALQEMIAWGAFIPGSLGVIEPIKV